MGELPQNSMRYILDKVQHTSACHQKYASILKKQSERNSEEFLKNFLPYVKIVLSQDCKDKSPFVRKLIDFLVLFCSSYSPIQDNEDHPVLKAILLCILDLSDCVHDPYRFWSCHVINKVFDKIEGLSEDMLDRIVKKILIRLQDPKAFIRYEAILSLHRLQDPSNEDDPIIKALLNSAFDSNARVRELCVSKTALTKATVPKVLERIMDVNVHVRMAVYQRFCKLVLQLKIAERRCIIKCGMFETEEKIKTFLTSDLLPTWLEIFENDCLRLLKSIRFDACEADVEETVHYSEFIINSLFKSQSIDEILQSLKINFSTKCLNFEDLNWESAIYYRMMIEYLHRSIEFERVREKVSPELVGLCRYIEGYINYSKSSECELDSVERQFILKQLFIIASSYDISDVSGRRCLNNLARDVLLKEQINAHVAQAIMSNLERIITNETGLSTFVCEIISNIMYGEEEVVDLEALRRKESEKCEQIVRVKSDIDHLRQEQEKMISESDFGKAHELETEIVTKQALLEDLQKPDEGDDNLPERKTDTDTILKYLTVAEALLLSVKVTRLSPAIGTLHTDVIQKILTHEDYEIKTKAFRCYTLCCILDMELARVGIHILSLPIFAYNSGEDCDAELLIVCIEGVVDLLRLFGSNLIAAPNSQSEELLSSSRREEAVKVFVGGTSLSDLVQALTDFLDDEDSKIQMAAAMSLSRLLLSSNRISCMTLVSKLILKWANPINDLESNNIKQVLGHTLERIPQLPNSDEYLDDIVITTIRTLVHAPRGSPLSDVNVENVTKFLVALCETSPMAREIRENLAVKVCSKMLDKPRARVNGQFSKLLLFLRLTNENEALIDDLLHICDQLRDVVTERVTSNSIVKFNATLNRLKQSLATIEE